MCVVYGNPTPPGIWRAPPSPSSGWILYHNCGLLLEFLGHNGMLVVICSERIDPPPLPPSPRTILAMLAERGKSFDRGFSLPHRIWGGPWFVLRSQSPWCGAEGPAFFPLTALHSMIEMEPATERDPLIERTNIFAGVDSGIKQKRNLAEKLHLPKLNRQKVRRGLGALGVPRALTGRHAAVGGDQVRSEPHHFLQRCRRQRRGEAETSG